MKANFTEHFFPWNEIFPWSSNKLYLLQKDFWENSFSYFFSDFKPNKEKVKYYFVDFCPLRGVKMIFFFLQIFCLLCIFVPEDDIFSLQNFYLLLDFAIFFFCLQMIFCPFRIFASCWISSFYYPDIFVPEDDIFSLHNLCLLLEFLLTRNQQTFVHQSEEGGGYSDFHARFHPNTSYRL